MAGAGPVLMVVAGETSGDERAAELISALKLVVPDLRAFGMGGRAMAAAGVEIIADISTTAIFGISEAITSIGKMKRIRAGLEEQWRVRNPSAVLLVDYGGFNLRLARRLKRRGARIAYYVSPQVWASRPGRIRWVRRYVDLMMVLFDFEERLYKERGVNVVHVGHPLVDAVGPERYKDSMLAGLGFESGRKTIGFMPGSRESELRRLLPELLRAARRLKERGYSQQFVIAAPGMTDVIRSTAGTHPWVIVEGDRYSAMAAADVLIMASGTAALEAALLGVPAVVVYKVSTITYLLARLLMRVKHVSIPNLILNEAVYPELLQGHCRGDAIATEAALILEDSVRYARIRARLPFVAESLGEPGAAERAARCLASFLETG